MIFCGRGSCLLLLGLLLSGNGPMAVAGGAFRDDADYLRRKFREDVTDPATGLGLAQLKVEAAKLAAELKDREPWCLVKAHLFEMICDKMAVGISSHDYFPAFACWSVRWNDLTRAQQDAHIRRCEGVTP